MPLINFYEIYPREMVPQFKFNIYNAVDMCCDTLNTFAFDGNNVEDVTH